MRKRKDNIVAEAPPAPIPLVRRDYIAAALTAIAALTVYILNLPPTVTGEDSGELIAAAYTLGIPHPPGYPLWCMLGHMFCWLPFGSVAWRVALMSAVWGAATVGIICLLVIRITRSRLAGAAAGLTLAFSAEFWAQSVIAEVYSLNALLIVLCLFILITWEQSRRNSLLYTFAAVYGLGLCNHHTMHYLGPFFALFIMAVHRHPWRYWRPYLAMPAIAFGLWGLIHLYLPIRSLANPPMDWGNPETLGGFLNTLLRGQYGQPLETMPRSPARLLEQILVFLKIYAGQFTWFLCWLPLLGLYPLWKQNRRHAALIVGLIVYLAAGIIWTVNFETDPQAIWVHSVFFIPCFMAAAILSGTAIAWLTRLRPRSIPTKPLAIALAIAIVLGPLAAHYRANDKSHYWFAYDYGMALLAGLEEDAYYFPAGDHTLFPLLYLQIVEGVRPDVTVAAKYGYIEPDLYADMPMALQQGFSNSKQHRLAVEAWLIQNRKNPMYFAINRPMPKVKDKKFITAGLVLQAVDTKTPLIDEDCLNRHEWRTLSAVDARDDYSALNFLHDYYFAKAMRFFERDEIAQAVETMATAAQLAAGRKDLLHNVANSMAQRNLVEEAKKYYLMVLEFAPNYRPSLNDLANACNALGDYSEARTYYERLVWLDQTTLGPNHPRVGSSLTDLGCVMVNLQDLSAARRCFEQALEIDQKALGPTHPNTARDLFNLALSLSYTGNESQAREAGTRAMEIFARAVPPEHPYVASAQKRTFIPSFGL